MLALPIFANGSEVLIGLTNQPAVLELAGWPKIHRLN